MNWLKRMAISFVARLVRGAITKVIPADKLSRLVGPVSEVVAVLRSLTRLTPTPYDDLVVDLVWAVAGGEKK